MQGKVKTKKESIKILKSGNKSTVVYFVLRKQ